MLLRKNGLTSGARKLGSSRCRFRTRSLRDGVVRMLPRAVAGAEHPGGVLRRAKGGEPERTAFGGVFLAPGRDLCRLLLRGTGLVAAVLDQLATSLCEKGLLRGESFGVGEENSGPIRKLSRDVTSLGPWIFWRRLVRACGRNTHLLLGSRAWHCSDAFLGLDDARGLLFGIHSLTRSRLRRSGCPTWAATGGQGRPESGAGGARSTTRTGARAQGYSTTEQRTETASRLPRAGGARIAKASESGVTQKFEQKESTSFPRELQL